MKILSIYEEHVTPGQLEFDSPALPYDMSPEAIRERTAVADAALRRALGEPGLAREIIDQASRVALDRYAAERGMTPNEVREEYVQACGTH